MNRSTKTSGRRDGAPVSLTREVIEKFGDRYKIEYPTAEKVLWLSRVMQAISVSPLAGDFALVGGSALVFLYRDLYRFSTDLDLDFIGNPQLGRRGNAEVTARITSDRAKLKQLAHDLGMRFVTPSRATDRFVQYRLEYRSEYTRTDAVELDLSYRYCHSVLGAVHRQWPLSIEGFLPRFKVQTLTQEELYASKLTAMVEGKERLDFPDKIGLMFKRKIRHLFDVYLLADDVLRGDSPVNLKRLHNLVVLFGLTRIRNFEFFRGNAIGSYVEEDIRRELKSVLPRGMPIPKVKDMKWQVRKFFDKHLYNWSEREHRFVEDFRAGNFRPEDIFGTGPVARGLHGMQYYREILEKVQTI